MQTIKDYEAMAKLELPEAERQWVSACADRLLQSFERLGDADAGDAPPLVTVLDVQNVLREDVAVKLLPREALLANAPEQYDGYFQAPKTLD